MSFATTTKGGGECGGMNESKSNKGQRMAGENRWDKRMIRECGIAKGRGKRMNQDLLKRKGKNGSSLLFKIQK